MQIFEHAVSGHCILSHMNMKTCTFLTLGLLISTGSGFSIDRPAGNTAALQSPSLTPYPSRPAPLPASRPVRLGIVPGTVPQAPAAPKPAVPVPRFDFGSAEDFQLKQAMNHLKGEPVVASIRSVAAANTAPTTVTPAKK